MRFKLIAPRGVQNPWQIWASTKCNKEANSLEWAMYKNCKFSCNEIVKWSVLLHHPKKSPLSRTQVELKTILSYFKSVITPFSSTTNQAPYIASPLELFQPHWKTQRWSSLLLYSRAKTHMAYGTVLASSLMQSLYTLAPQVITSLIIRQESTEELLNQFLYFHCRR